MNEETWRWPWAGRNALADKNGSIDKNALVDELCTELYRWMEGRKLPFLSLLCTDINHMKLWRDFYGEWDREKALCAHYEAVVRAQEEVRHRYNACRLEFVSRYRFDKLLLCDTGNPRDLPDIAGTLQWNLNTTPIPGVSKRGGEQDIEVEGQHLKLNPAYLGVRVGAACQRAPLNPRGLVERTLQAAKEAKGAERQIVVVRYIPGV